MDINITIEGQALDLVIPSPSWQNSLGRCWVGLDRPAAASPRQAGTAAMANSTPRADHPDLGLVSLGLGLAALAQAEAPQATTTRPASSAAGPALADIPIIGPVFFQATIFLYLTYLALALVQVGLFSTRWGLRTRAVGEHPVAADTVGIRVYATRYRNVIMAGALAGIGGAYLTIGSVGSFAKGMSSGEGYIALAAMIFGRYTPFGAIGAALLFGFSTQLQSILSTMNVPIQSNLLLATPYVVTIIVVAGLVGKVRPPKAEGIPYVKA